MLKRQLAKAALAFGVLCSGSPVLTAYANQAELPINTKSQGRMLNFDWPALRIGTAEYPAGPTGVTVFHFPNRGQVAIDYRGGGPGTINAPYVDIGYGQQELDSIVFAGGSWYGLETAPAVASAMLDDGLRDGNAFGGEPNIAMSLGSIIFDFGTRRLNDIYPDKRLAQAAYRAAQPGRFPLGAQGAGRLAKSGGFFGCDAHSGQGGAFRQLGELKVAAFVVANSVGVITDRDGRVQACYRAPEWAFDEPLLARDLMAGAQGSMEPSANTTISLIVVNQPMAHWELKRLAVQTHMSMARGIQPFATVYDGDVLYAVSTNELTEAVVPSPQLGVIASELMWDALLSTVPEQPDVHNLPARQTPAPTLQDSAGVYSFSADAELTITIDRGKVYAKTSGARSVFGIDAEKSVPFTRLGDGDWHLPGRYPVILRFESNRLVLNPGRWQQVGFKP